jgi:hypothetical protein
MVSQNKSDATRVFKIDTMDQSVRNTRGLEMLPKKKKKIEWAVLRVANEEPF